MVMRLRHVGAHDYRHLIRRWRALAPRAGLKLQKYAESGGYSLYCIASRRLLPGVPSVYFSAGIHGDEVGATEGLIQWAEAHGDLLAKMNVLIFPCLNAWGLVNNCRRDVDGRDLNRSYHDQAVPQIAAQMKYLMGRPFDLALTLHEDYDAEGVYLYEVPRKKPYWGEALLRAASRFIGPDLRKKIEGRPASGGVVRSSIKPDMMPDWPEAFALYFQNAGRVFTVETPSEFHLDARVDAQSAVIEAAVKKCMAEFRANL